MEAVVNTLHDILAGNRNGNLCLGSVCLILAKIIMDIYSTIRQRTSFEQAPLDFGYTLCFAGNVKEDESKADNLFISFEKMSIKFEEKTGSEKSKKKRDRLPKQTVPFLKCSN